MKKLFLALMLVFGISLALQASESAEEKILDASNTMKRLANATNGIPKAILKEAKAIVVVPSLHRAGFMVGMKYGEGVASIRRADGSWSYPFFVEIGGGSFGIQLGYENVATILVFRTSNSVNELMSEKFTLGAGASASAGPIAANYEKNAEVNMSAEIFTYSQANGLFAGASLEGAVITNKEEKNRALYGSDITIKKIVNSRDLSETYSVQEFLRTITNLTK